MQQRLLELTEMAQLAEQLQDRDFGNEVAAAVDDLEEQLRQTQLSLAMNGPHDDMPAIITLNSGAGGTDSHDWVEMLLGMYTAWAQRERRPTKLMNTSYGERAGLRTATLEIGGPRAYGHLRHEAGVHRVARNSRFDPTGRRQTSFARIEVLPAVPEQGPVEMNPQDVKFDAFHSSGRGGQHIQKVATAVRLTHTPTGLTVTCQTERSQKQNREYATRILRARLLERQERQKREDHIRKRGETQPPEWGHQVRSYFLRPPQLVLDHRTGHRTGNPQTMLNGDLSGFIEAALLLRGTP